ncbi:MAG: integrin alpha [Candidatus Hermodarchaeota archaeon]
MNNTKIIRCFVILMVIPSSLLLYPSTGVIQSNEGIGIRISDILSQGRGVIITTNRVEYLGVKHAGAHAIDINNDAIDDLLIGGNEMHIFFGHTGVWSNHTVEEADATIINNASTTKISNPVGVGDVNKDGFPDVIMASFWDISNGDIETNTAAKAYLFFGGNNSDWTVGTPVTSADATFNAEKVGDYMGHGLDGVGDCNNDGYDDIVITSEFNDQAGNDAGKAYLILGRPSNDWNRTTNITEAASGSFLGSTIGSKLGVCAAGVGDVNNDGFDDFLLSANKSPGRIIYLIFGRSLDKWHKNVPIEDVANITILISTEDDHGGAAGRYMSGLGDVNKDGLDDFAFGAYKDNEGGTQAGQVFVFFGRKATQWPSTPTTVYASDYANASFIGESINDNAGFSVSGAGDINGDGHDDILIGAANGDANVKGKAYVIFGPANTWNMDQSLSQADLIFTGDYLYYDLTGSNSFFAFDVSGIGDINNDNYADFYISAPYVNYRRGIILVIFGGTSWIPSKTTPMTTPIILLLALAVVLLFRERIDQR